MYENEINEILQDTNLAEGGEESVFFTELAGQAKLTYEGAIRRLLKKVVDVPDTDKPAKKLASRYMITGEVMPHPEAVSLPYLYKYLPYEEAESVTRAIKQLLCEIDSKLFGGLHR
jgi:hypothetical protein